MASKRKDDEIFNQAKKFVMFINERGDAMHFLLMLRNKDEQTRIRSLIQNHFGGVAESAVEFGPHTIVLVDDNVLYWTHSGDVFKVSYVEKCISEGVVLDISKFLKATSRAFVPEFNFMEVVYFKKYSWQVVPHKYRFKEESSDSDTDNSVISLKSKRRRGSPYSWSEKEAILKYVANHFSITGHDTLKGVSLWQTMEREKVCGRTWQSMKEHFLKVLSKELSSFKCLSQDEVKRIKRALS